METYRLKNIVILILLLLNLFLLGLILHLRLQQRHTSLALEQQLTRLYENSGISLPEDLDAGALSLPPIETARSLSDEADLAAYLMGQPVETEDQGGGIYTYTGLYGSVQFRSSGAFDYAPALPPSVSDPEAFCETFSETFGYRYLSASFADGGGSYQAVRQVSGTDVYNCTISLHFSDHRLISASGVWVSTASTSLLTQPSFTAADALSRFLSYRSESGVVCNAVTAVRQVYALQTPTPSTLQLSPQWQVETDTYCYYVNCLTGEVQRT